MNSIHSKKFPWNRLWWRLQDGGVWYDEATGNIVCACRAAAYRLSTVGTWNRYGYGTYDWYAKIVNPEPNKLLFVGAFEEFSSAWYQNGIFIYHNGSRYLFETATGGNKTTTDLNDQNWTTEKHFRVEWISGSCKLYITDMATPVAIHTTDVPSVNMIRFIEVLHLKKPSNPSYVYGKEFW